MAGHAMVMVLSGSVVSPITTFTIFPARKPTVLTVGGIAEHYKTTVDGI
jgi:hypothetical protein